MVQNSKTLREFGQKMGYSLGGGHTAVAAQKVIDVCGLQEYAQHFLNKEKQVSFYPEVAAAASKTLPDFNISDATYKKVLIKDRGYRCECCGISEWNGMPAPLEMHHKDGDHTNSKLDNLELLCANCHSLTENYGGKNRKTKTNTNDSSENLKKKSSVSDNDYIEAIIHSPNATEALRMLGLNYKSGYQFGKLKEIKDKYKVEYKTMRP